MFARPEKVGAFAVPQEEFARGDANALFRLLVAATMFQRRQDLQVQRILVGLRTKDVEAMTSPAALLRAAARGKCSALHSLKALHEQCDLTKNGGAPTCSGEASSKCHLKRHALLLKRYGDFGKLPTSAAYVSAEAGAGGLAALRAKVLAEHTDPLERAKALEAAISAVWRVSTKIACMFLSCVSNPDLSPGAPWTQGARWQHYVVIDSNVDRFLTSIGFSEGRDYESKRRFITELSERLDLSAMDQRITHQHNPRLVQQAMYLFMSASNRAAMMDCSREQQPECATCPRLLRERCAFWTEVRKFPPIAE